MSAADVWWTTGTGCTGANEHGAFSGKTVSQCAALCVGIAGNGCISFEFKTASGTTNNCQLSSSCNTLHASFNPCTALTCTAATWPPTEWWLFIRGTSTIVAPNYDKIAMRGCTGANELGVYDVTDTLATCAARCDALETCISFEFRTSDGKCYLSSSCNQASAGYVVGTFDLYIKQRDGWYHSPSPPPPSPSPPPSFPPFAPLLAGQSIVATNSTVVSLGLTFAGDLSNYPTPQIASLKNATDGCENHYERCVNHGVRVKKRHAAAQDRHGVQVKIRRGVPGGCV